MGAGVCEMIGAGGGGSFGRDSIFPDCMAFGAKHKVAIAHCHRGSNGHRGATYYT